MFATGIESSSPTLDQGRRRVDEMALCGHYDHWHTDFELLSDLGVNHLRYGPPLHTAWIADGRYDWAFADETFRDLKSRDITPIADTTRYVATHGSPWDYDRRVPILFWRPGATGATIEHSAETIDIMPTLAGMIGLPVEAGSVDGRCLSDVPGACTPR